MRTMYDAVNASDVPASGFDLLAGYVNGAYPTAANPPVPGYETLQQRFPHAVVVGIDVLNRPGSGQVLDIESGDATPADAPGWYDASIRAGVHRPTLYFSASLYPQVSGAIGSRPADLWIAEYGPRLTVSDKRIVAWQKADRGPNGENIDVSDVFDDTWNPTGGFLMALTDAEQAELLKDVRTLAAQPWPEIVGKLRDVWNVLGPMRAEEDQIKTDVEKAG